MLELAPLTQLTTAGAGGDEDGGPVADPSGSGHGYGRWDHASGEFGSGSYSGGSDGGVYNNPDSGGDGYNGAGGSRRSNTANGVGGA